VTTHILAIDEGGTGVRAYLFDRQARVAAAAYSEIGLSCPRPGWVEHDAEAIWQQTFAMVQSALRQAGIAPTDLSGVGIANQRSSALAWDAETGRAVYPAIGWQDLRTAAHCEELGRRGYTLNPFQSATKFAWIVKMVPGARALADAGRLRFGTIDTWLAWKLSGGRVFVTDASNACCTGLYDFVCKQWDETLIEMLELPHAGFAEIVPTSAVVGDASRSELAASVPLAARAGDQQAAMFGQLCTEPGMTKITYGTSAMMDLNVGSSLRLSPHGAFPMVLWEREGAISYALEGTAVTAGAAIQWLRDGLGIIREVAESGTLATSVPDSGGVWCVPAFQGLGTPHLDPSARAVIGGLSRGTGRAHVVRGVLEGIACRCAEILDAMRADAGSSSVDALRVDGGAARNDFLMQYQADITGIPVERPVILEAATLGVAYLAGLAAGFWSDLSEVARTWQRDRVFEPRMTSDERGQRMERWRTLVDLARQTS